MCVHFEKSFSPPYGCDLYAFQTIYIHAHLVYSHIFEYTVRHAVVVRGAGEGAGAAIGAGTGAGAGIGAGTGASIATVAGASAGKRAGDGVFGRGCSFGCLEVAILLNWQQ